MNTTKEHSNMNTINAEYLFESSQFSNKTGKAKNKTNFYVRKKFQLE